MCSVAFLPISSGLSAVSGPAAQHHAGSVKETAGLLGLSAQAMAAIQMTPTKVRTAMEAIRSADTLLRDLQAARDQGVALLAEKRQLAAAKPTDDEAGRASRDRLSAIATQLETVRAGQALIEGRLLDAALIGVDSATRARFVTWQHNAGSSLPAGLRLVEWSADERRAIELALVEERRATQSGKELSSRARTTLDSARGRSESTAARQAIQENETAITAVLADF
ncbi:hypothetical protein D4Q85_00090 [bacterium]|nr:MAG: hypothetical protein D4Q85_00090 [bacterium]